MLSTVRRNAPVHQAHLQDAPLAAGVQVFGDEIPHFSRIEEMQVEGAVDRPFDDRLVVYGRQCGRRT